MLKAFGLFVISLIFLTSCSKKEDQSKLKPTLSSMGMVIQVQYNSFTNQTEFFGDDLNWLGNTGTDYVVGLSPGAAPVVEGSAINMTMPGYIPGQNKAFIPGSARLSRVFICPAAATHYSRVICSSPAFCP